MNRKQALVLLSKQVAEVDLRHFHHPQPDFYTYFDFPQWLEYIISDQGVRSHSLDDVISEVETPTFTTAYNYSLATGRCPDCGELSENCQCEDPDPENGNKDDEDGS